MVVDCLSRLDACVTPNMNTSTEALALANGIVLKDDRILVHKTMRRNLLTRIHNASHSRIKKRSTYKTKIHWGWNE